jgi:hypothetical protein
MVQQGVLVYTVTARFLRQEKTSLILRVLDARIKAPPGLCLLAESLRIE